MHLRNRIGSRARCVAWFAAFVLSLFIAPSYGHHSITMYDRTIETSISGTVTQWDWTNPHCWLQIMVDDENGTPRLWVLEANSTGQMARGGWTADSVKPGDQVTVIINPIRDGTRAGRLGTVHFSDGRELHRAGDASGTRSSPF
jgi:hypothetical protein